MSRMKPTFPSYRHHKASGQAVVTLSGKDIYLGAHGTRISKDTYDRVVSEWLAAGRSLPRPAENGGLTVAELVNSFRKATQPDRDDIKGAMVMLVRLYARAMVADFGPLALKAVREQMVLTGWKRKVINARIHCLRRIFRWGVEHELVASDVLQALEAVQPLKAGKTKAPESEEIRPVAAEHVDACLPFMAPMVQAMVRVQMFTGMRSGELCVMRTGDIDTTGEVWIYKPAQHKTLHLGKSREITIGQRGQALLRPYLLPDLKAFIFSPARADAERKAIVHAARKTPLSCGNRPTGRSRKMADHYDTPTYRNAIEYAIHKAFPVPAVLAMQKGESTTAWRARLGEKWADVLAWRREHHWHPHQLRHSFGTNVREHFDGLDHAQAAMGHSHANTAEIYAKVARRKAVEVAAAIG